MSDETRTDTPPVETAEEASELLSDSARGHHVSVSDMALCVVLDLELR